MFRFSDLIKPEPEKKGEKEKKGGKEEASKERGADSQPEEWGGKVSDIISLVTVTPDAGAASGGASTGRPSAASSKGSEPEERRPVKELGAHGLEEVGASDVLEALDMQLQKYKELHQELVEYMAEVVEAAKRNKGFSIEKGMSIIREVLKDRSAVDLFPMMEDEALKGVEHLVVHSINVMAFSIKTGVGLGLSDDQLARLSLAALLHDVGMVSVPELVQGKKEKLSDSEIKMLKEHPFQSYKIILAQGREHEWLADIVSQEHERADGTGYPRGLKGDQVHEYAQIIGLSDMYEAMTHSRPYRKAQLPFDTFNQLVKGHSKEFPPKILKAMMSQLTIFPLLSYVKLNTNAVGRVIKIDEKAPIKPTVIILFDSKQRKLEVPKVVDLKTSPLLYIVGCVSIEEMGKISR